MRKALPLRAAKRIRAGAIQASPAMFGLGKESASATPPAMASARRNQGDWVQWLQVEFNAAELGEMGCNHQPIIAHRQSLISIPKKLLPSGRFFFAEEDLERIQIVALREALE